MSRTLNDKYQKLGWDNFFLVKLAFLLKKIKFSGNMPSPPLDPLFSSLNVTLGCYLNTYEKKKSVYQIMNGAFWTSKKAGTT